VKEIRPWQSRLLMRVVHIYFAIARGMTMGVRAACFDAEGRVFLVRHSYVPGWHMPGGGLERSETAEEALVKELREEGNLKIVGRPQLVQVYFNTSASGATTCCFTAQPSSRRRPGRRTARSSNAASLRSTISRGNDGSTHRRLAEVAGERQPDPSGRPVGP
jgi:ADP-ribose pyrophosphatase YjhB (NUDIX family)